uniref:Phosphoinositide phospholipase C n=1 Tax=Romanomermis culicivorax TaxID=13658 RepID=A0A915IYZ9_ROMCU
MLEMDIWDNSPEPVITHGHTLVNPIRLRDVTKTIDQYAFVTSNYPVILSLEVHCSLKNQRKIAEILREILGEKLYTVKNDDQSSFLPSPEELKRKILLKGFKIPAWVKESVWTPNEKEFLCAQSDPDHASHKIVQDKKADKSEKQISIARELSDLIALPIYAIRDIKQALIDHPYNAVANFSENKLPDVTHPTYESYLTYARQRLIRIYPFGLRTDSSNLNPLRFWQAGVQTVSLNVQHADLSNDLNDALFKLNGNCGYILKPAVLREGSFLHKKVQNWSKRTILRIQIISAQYLPRPKADNDIIDPYVLLQVHGLDCDSTGCRTNYIKNNGKK